MSNLETDNQDYFRELDNDIAIDELQKVINHTSNNKSVDLDNLPFEVFKNNGSDEILTLLFNKMYDFSLTPSILAIIKPMPKNALADPCLPIKSLGISLLFTVYKLF
jgi:hypothetical protein